MEEIKTQPTVVYKGVSIEHFPVHWKYKGKDWWQDGYIIKSPVYIQSNSNKEKTYMPLYCEDKKGNVLNFSKLDDAKQYIDKYIENHKGKIVVKHGDEIHFQLYEQEDDEDIEL